MAKKVRAKSVLSDGKGGRPPLALAAIGMPGCTAYVDVRLSFPLTVTSGAGTWGAVVPNDQSLLGRSLFTQVLAVDAAANALGATTSDAVQVVIGR